jgi:hypothetical protein
LENLYYASTDENLGWENSKFGPRALLEGKGNRDVWGHFLSCGVFLSFNKYITNIIHVGCSLWNWEFQHLTK